MFKEGQIGGKLAAIFFLTVTSNMKKIAPHFIATSRITMYPYLINRGINPSSGRSGRDGLNQAIYILRGF